MITRKKLASATLLFLVFIYLIPVGKATAQYGLANAQTDTLTQSVIIHPVIEGKLVSSEHEYKSHLRLGDQLGRDFTVAEMQDDGIAKRYKNKGKKNSDWYGWRKNELAPLNGTVIRVNNPDTTNIPGTMNRDAQPGIILFQKQNNITVLYAHAREIKVDEGQKVKAGEVVAKIGNNGNSRLPHIHVGAWKDETPLQIQVDLYADEKHEKKK